MPISVICGGQFGSEGKGKATHFFAKNLNAKAVIRVGGPNSGHTVILPNGSPLVLKQLPTASIIDEMYCIISSGSYINIEILLQEIIETKINEKYLCIDPYAVIITADDLQAEDLNDLKQNIGSTASGLGSALSKRVNRVSNLKFAKDEPILSKYIKNTKSLLRHFLQENERIIIEGTQGFGLSLLHSDLYPFTTSRDTSAAAFVSEAGLSPLDVDDIIMVIRTYPIRVAGNSGPLPKEISWNKVTHVSGSTTPLIEYTSVTKKIRRVAEFDSEIVKRSIEINRPTKIVLNHVDYFDKKIENNKISEKTFNKVKEIESIINHKIDYIGINRNDLLKNEINIVAKTLSIINV